jgi:hypothetical protein
MSRPTNYDPHMTMSKAGDLEKNLTTTKAEARGSGKEPTNSRLAVEWRW